MPKRRSSASRVRMVRRTRAPTRSPCSRPRSSSTSCVCCSRTRTGSTNYSFDGDGRRHRTPAPTSRSAARGRSETWRPRADHRPRRARARRSSRPKYGDATCSPTASSRRTMVTGPHLDHMTARGTLDRGVASSPTSTAFREEQAAGRDDEGRYLGIGIATFVEAAPGPKNYGAALGAGSSPRTRATGARPAGARRDRQRVHEPAAPRPGPRDHASPSSPRTGSASQSSRSGSCTATPASHRSTPWAPVEPLGHAGQRGRRGRGGPAPRPDRRAVRGAPRARPGDVEVVGGTVAARRHACVGVGSDAPIAELADDVEVAADSAIPDGGWTQATHCCWVEVDVNTGMVRIPRYLVVEDCGAMINPNIVEGQVRGRRRAGPVDGAVRAVRLRRRRPAPRDHAARLPPADGGGGPRHRDRAPRVTAAGPDRLPGCRRERRRGLPGRAHERDRRRARAVRRAN